MSYKILNISKFSNSHSIFSSPSVSPASHAASRSVYAPRIHSQPKRALPHYTPQAKYSLFIIHSRLQPPNPVAPQDFIRTSPSFHGGFPPYLEPNAFRIARCFSLLRRGFFWITHLPHSIRAYLSLADMADIYSYICNIVRMCRCMCIYTSRKLLVLCPLCPPFLVL